MNRADRVWNRAAEDAGGPVPREGDRALASMLLAHGLVMNGGVLHAVESLEASEVEAACRGFEYFNLGQVAAVLGQAASAVAAGNDELDDLEEKLDKAYSKIVRDDRALEVTFRKHFLAQPDAYAPLDAAGDD